MEVKLNSIVLIADRINENISKMDINSNQLEKIDNKYFNEVFTVLKKLFDKVFHYNTPKEFIDNIKMHKYDFVFTIYGGEASRNRMALIPAICESYNIKYAGADSYARIICQDKQITKDLCSKLGLITPKYIVYDKFQNTGLIENLNLPLVVKPILEGSSIGISEDSLVQNHIDALNKAEKIFNKFSQPVLIEEFIGGREVSVCIYGNQEKINGLEIIEVYFEGEEDFFNSNLFTAKEKCNRKINRKIRLITDLISNEDKKLFESVFFYLGKIDYLRIDGKLINGKFNLIELTPDAHLGKDTHFASAFYLKGVNYSDLILAIINSSLNGYQNSYAND